MPEFNGRKTETEPISTILEDILIIENLSFVIYSLKKDQFIK